MKTSPEDSVYNWLMNNRLKVAIGCFSFVIALFAGVAIYNATNDTPQKEITVVSIASPAPISPIFQGTLIEQSFITNLRSLSKVSIYVATYLKSNLPGKGFFELSDTSGKVLTSQQFELASLKDNEYFSFNFKSLDVKPGSQYFFTLTSDVKPTASTFTLWSNQGFSDKSFILKENRNVINGAIIFNLTGK